MSALQAKLRAKLAAAKNVRSSGMNPMMQRAVKTMDPKEFNETQDMYKDMGKKSKKTISSLLKTLPGDQIDQLEANVNTLPADQANQIKHFLQNRRKASGKLETPTDAHVAQIYVPLAERMRASVSTEDSDPSKGQHRRRAFAPIQVNVPTIQQLNAQEPRELLETIPRPVSEVQKNRETFSPHSQSESMREAVLEANESVRFSVVLRGLAISPVFDPVMQWVESLQIVARVHFFNAMNHVGIRIVEKGNVWTLFDDKTTLGFIKIT